MWSFNKSLGLTAFVGAATWLIRVCLVGEADFRRGGGVHIGGVLINTFDRFRNNRGIAFVMAGLLVIVRRGFSGRPRDRSSRASHALTGVAVCSRGLSR